MSLTLRFKDVMLYLAVNWYTPKQVKGMRWGGADVCRYIGQRRWSWDAHAWARLWLVTISVQAQREGYIG